MSDPVRFQQITFHNTLGIAVAVATDDGGGSGFVDRGTVGPHSQRDIHVGLSNCRSIAIRASADGGHSPETFTLVAGSGGGDYITNAEVAYYIGSFSYRLTLTSEKFTGQND